MLSQVIPQDLVTNRIPIKLQLTGMSNLIFILTSSSDFPTNYVYFDHGSPYKLLYYAWVTCANSRETIFSSNRYANLRPHSLFDKPMTEFLPSVLAQISTTKESPLLPSCE